MISKELFCKILQMIQEQQAINDEFSDALQNVGTGYFIFGADNKYHDALLLLLKEVMHDKYDYIDWWLYEATNDYTIWSKEEDKTWYLKEPEALYDYIVNECQQGGTADGKVH